MTEFNAPPPPPVLLTRREHEVLAWIAQGKSDWQIGQILGLSAKTINFHTEKLKRKFGVATRLQAVVCGLQLALIAKP